MLVIDNHPKIERDKRAVSNFSPKFGRFPKNSQKVPKSSQGFPKSSQNLPNFRKILGETCKNKAKVRNI